MILFPFSFLQFALLVEDPQKENDGPYEIRKKKKRGLISDVIRKSRLEVGITSLLFCFPLQVYLSRLMSRFSRFQRNKLRMISIKKKKKPHVPNKKKKKMGQSRFRPVSSISIKPFYLAVLNVILLLRLVIVATGSIISMQMISYEGLDLPWIYFFFFYH